jgi:hypothetical protein
MSTEGPLKKVLKKLKASGISGIPLKAIDGVDSIW